MTEIWQLEQKPHLGRNSETTVRMNTNVTRHSQASSEEDPFAEYMWMENEEEFDRQVEEELWEEDFMEQCFLEMLEEEEWEWFIPSRDLVPHNVNQLEEQVSLLDLNIDVQLNTDFDNAITSNLNPNAKEFTPGKCEHTL